MKKDKKDKHGNSTGKEDGKSAGKHKMKNVHTFSIVGQGKKNIDQDTYVSFEIMEENIPVKFFGVFDGHGDFGKEVSRSESFNSQFVGVCVGKCGV